MQFSLSKIRQGEALILSGSMLMGFFPILVVLTYAHIGPIASLAYATVFALLFFVVVMTFRKKWSDLWNGAGVLAALQSGLLLGVLLFPFLYIGLSMTSPGNASLLLQADVLFSFLFFHIWKKDAVTPRVVTGALCAVAGVLLILFQNTAELNLGDAFIVLAAACAPVGNYFSKKAREHISSESILFVRNLIALPCLFLLAALFSQIPSWTAVQPLIPLIALIGIVMLGIHKIMWIEGIHRIPVAKAVSLSSVTPLVTLLFSWVILHQQPTVVQLVSFFPLAAGVYLLTSESPVSRN